MASSTTGNPNNPWGPYDSYRDCSQGICSVYCPQWCYVIFPPPPSFFLDDEDDSSSSDFSPLLIAIIGILASAFILVSYYTLISKYCRRRRDGASSSTSGVTGISINESWRENNNGVSNSTMVVGGGGGDGLDESLIKSITVYKFRKGDGFVESSDCSVCLSEFQEDESLRLLPKCNHAFHLLCIDTWLKSHSNCPLCRAGINAGESIQPPIVTESADSTEVHHQSRDSDSESVVVISDLETRSRNETVAVNNANGGSSPKPPELLGGDEVSRRSAARNSGGGVVLISDILREIEDEEEAAGVGTSRRLEDGDGEKTPETAANQTNGISSFLVRSSMAMKRSVSAGKFTLSERGRNYRLPN